MSFFLILLFISMVAAWLHFYRFTLQITLSSRQLRVYWLPRVFGGWAEPVLLYAGSKKRPSLISSIKSLFSLEEEAQSAMPALPWKRLLTAARIMQLNFQISSSASLSCILFLPLGEAISIIIKEQVKKRWQSVCKRSRL